MNARNNSDRLETACGLNYNEIHNVEDISEDSPPVTEPVGLQEMKDYLRLEDYDALSVNPTEEFDFDDALIESMITEARNWVEKFTGINLIPKTLRVDFTCGVGLLRFPGPITSTLSDIAFTDKNGNAYTGEVFWIGQSFPKLDTTFTERMQVTYNAGYVTAPDWAKNAIKAYVAWAYENRGDDKSGATERAAAIARPYRRIQLFG